MAHAPRALSIVLAGDGSERAALERLAVECGVHDRVTIKGHIDGDALVSLYAGALAVIYAPYDEDYGYVTLEAFLSSKPVVTCSDSGGTLEFVVDGENGFVCAPAPESIGAALTTLAADRALAPRLGAAGLGRARQITWDGVVERLVG
jgi:glycosyltransferase involved in cell wall biosynthesis